MTSPSLVPDNQQERAFPRQEERLADGNLDDRRWGRIFLGLAVLSAMVLSVPALGPIPLALDEHGSYWTIDADVEASITERSLHCTAMPPLSSWVQFAFLTIIGQNETVFRLPSLLAYWLAVVVAWRVGNRLGGPVMGGLSALVLAWHPEVLQEVRFARSYGLVLLLSMGLVDQTLAWLRMPYRAWRPWLWGGLGAALVWTHYLTVPFVALCGLCLLLPKRWRWGEQNPRGRDLGIAVGVSVTASLPLTAAVLRTAEWGPVLNFHAPNPPFAEVLGPFWWIAVPVAVTTAWGLQAIVGGSGRRTASRNAWITLALLSLLPALMIAILAQGDRSSLANPRYRVSLAGPAACLLVLAVGYRSRRWTAGLGCAAGLIALWSLNDVSPWQPTRLGNPTDFEWREMAHRIAEDTSDREPIFVQSSLVESSLVPAFYADRIFSSYAACRMGRFYLPTDQPRYAMPFNWSANPAMTTYYEETLREFQSERIWIACATDTDLNQASLAGMERLMRRVGFVEEFRHDFPAATLLRYRHQSQLDSDGSSTTIEPSEPR